MSHHAHGTNKVYGHGSRTRGMEPGSATQGERFSLRDLHPELYRPTPPTLRNRRMTDDERRAAIIDDLRTNGPATAVEIDKRLGISKNYTARLLADGIDGVVVERTVLRGSRTVNVWGLKHKKSSIEDS